MPIQFTPLGEWSAAVDKLPPDEWIIKDFVMADCLTFVSGYSKTTRKTYFAFLMVIAAATGTAIGGFEPTRPFRCGILEAEGGRKKTRARLQRLMQGAGALTPEAEAAMMQNIFIMHRQPFKLDNPIHVELLVKEIRRLKLEVILIDAFKNATTGDENNAAAIGKALDGLAVIRNAECSPILLLHVKRPPPEEYQRKRKKDDGEEKWPDIDHDIRGSSAIEAAYDTHIALRQRYGEGEEDPRAVIVRHKDAGPGQYGMKIEFQAPYGTGPVTVQLYNTNPDGTLIGLAKPMRVVKASEYQKDMEVLEVDRVYGCKDFSILWNMDAFQAGLRAKRMTEAGLLEQVQKEPLQWKKQA